jgi:type IV pilus assembly protein PilY1
LPTTAIRRVVLQAANDGMVHVFNAASGAEEWAYIPDVLLSQSRDPSNANTSTLNMLSRLSGYYHRYYIDGTPAVGDVDFSNTAGVSGNPNPDWRTIAVGGLGKGGRGFYALDLTTPTASSEADAAAKVLWEFPNSATDSTLKLNIGYSYGKPVITKTAAYGWVVLVTSGYNNGTGTDNSGGDGHGYIWVLDAKTGNVLNTIDTGVGTTGDPSGLAHIAAWADNADLDNTATYVYGGDLKGNLWRFDLTDSTGTIIYTARKLAVLKNASGVTQPVTTVPELASIAVSSALTKRFVFVGTGQYLGDSDVTTTQTQTMYGIVDDLSTASDPVIANPTRDSLVAQAFTTSGTTRTVSNNTVDYTTKKGWYIDLPITGERVNTDPALALGALFFTSNIPSSAADCRLHGNAFVDLPGKCARQPSGDHQAAQRGR